MYFNNYNVGSEQYAHARTHTHALNVRSHDPLTSLLIVATPIKRNLLSVEAEMRISRDL